MALARWRGPLTRRFVVVAEGARISKKIWDAGIASRPAPRPPRKTRGLPSPLSRGGMEKLPSPRKKLPETPLARQRQPDHRAADLRHPSRMRHDRRALRGRRDS